MVDDETGGWGHVDFDVKRYHQPFSEQVLCPSKQEEVCALITRCHALRQARGPGFEDLIEALLIELRALLDDPSNWQTFSWPQEMAEFARGDRRN